MWKVLVADDVQANRELLVELLRDQGECTCAANGLEAWVAYMAARQNNAPFDVILLDIVMPEMDGLTFLAQLREFEDKNGVDENTRIPVIVMSAFQHPQLIDFDLQKDDFMLKPINGLKLLEIIASKVKTNPSPQQ